MAYRVMAYIVMAYTGIAHVVMAYVVMASIAIAEREPRLARSIHAKVQHEVRRCIQQPQHLIHSDLHPERRFVHAIHRDVPVWL